MVEIEGSNMSGLTRVLMTDVSARWMATRSARPVDWNGTVVVSFAMVRSLPPSA